jgi:hypothetical protein
MVKSVGPTKQWAAGPVWPFWRSENGLDHTGIRNPDRPARNLVAMPEILISLTMWTTSRSQWLRGLKCASAAVRLLGLRVWISPEARMSLGCECCVSSG